MGTDITIEVLYGEFANLFGELQNVNYLKDCMPEATVIYTGLYDNRHLQRAGQTLYIWEQ